MAQNEQRSVLTQEHIEERRLGVHRTILTLVCVVVLGACNGPAGGGVTQVKYIYDRAASSVLLPDDTVITAPAGKHYGLFFINCVDNSSRTSGFWFVGDRLRDNNNQATQNNQVHDVIS
jgi:hypothetical protein